MDMGEVSLTEKLEKVSQSPKLSLFFDEIWEEDSMLAKIFFAHREEIFPSIEEIHQPMPYLFWNNFSISTMREPSLIEIKMKLDQIELEKASLSPDEKALYDIRDLIFFYFVQFLRSSQILKKLIEMRDFSFEGMKRELKDYESLKSDLSSYMKEVTESLEQISMIKDPVLKSRINELKKLRWLDFPRFLDIAKPYLSKMTLSPSISGWAEELCEKRGIEYEEYTSVIEHLFAIKLINNIQSVFWCENCRDEVPIFVSSSRISPFQLRMKCLKCGKPMFVSSVYRVDETLGDLILCKDGLLAVALAYILNKNGIAYEYSIINEFEKDFLCDTSEGKVVIECKMNKSPKDADTVRSHLQNVLGQIIKHLRSLEKRNVHVVKSYALLNYDLNEYPDVIKKVVNQPNFIEGIKIFKIKPIGYKDVPAIVQKLK